MRNVELRLLKMRNVELINHSPPDMLLNPRSYLRQQLPFTQDQALGQSLYASSRIILLVTQVVDTGVPFYL